MKHHCSFLYGEGEEMHKTASNLSIEGWVLFEYNSFDLSHINSICYLYLMVWLDSLL